jgi:4-amino-4-deoxy-L-arabinose transferase-like glycosyltransferase
MEVVQPRSRIPLLTALGALAILLVYYSQTVAFTWDEGFHLLAAQLIKSGKRPYLDFCFPQAPLNAWFTAACLRLFGDSWRTAHMAQALLTIAAMALAAGYVFQRFPRSAASIVTAVLIGANAMVVEFGTVGQAYGTCLFLLVAAFRVTVAAAARPRLLLATAAGALAGAAAASSLLTAPAVPVLLVWLAYHSAGRRRVYCPAAFVAGALIPFLPTAWLFVQDPGRTWFNLAGFQLFSRHSTFQGSADNDLDVLTSWISSLQALLLGLLAAAGLLWGRHSGNWGAARKSEIALCGWLALAIGAELCLAHPTFPRYFLLVVPFLAIAAGAGFSELTARLAPLSSGTKPALAVAVLLLLGLGRALYERGNVYRWRQLEPIAARVNAITPPDGEFWSYENIYFLTRRMPPEGMEFSYAVTLNLSDGEAARLHIARDRDIARRVRAGEFAAVALCDEPDVVEAMDLPHRYRRTAQAGNWQIFWELAR